MKPAVWDGHYTKRDYIVHLPGECVKCWPNAGVMNALDGSGRIFKPDGKLVVSVLPNEEADRYDAEDAAIDSAGPFPVAPSASLLEEMRRYAASLRSQAANRFAPSYPLGYPQPPFPSRPSGPNTWAEHHLEERKRRKRERYLAKKRRK
jgi:hypothetical protein